MVPWGEITPEARATLEAAAQLWLFDARYKHALKYVWKLPRYAIRLAAGLESIDDWEFTHRLTARQLEPRLKHLAYSTFAQTTSNWLGFLQTLSSPALEPLSHINVEQTAENPLTTFEVPQQTTFHLFLRLPVELQIMIWKTAASPAPCRRYALLTKRPFPLGQHGYRGDRGLWGACRLSRFCIEQVYSKPPENCLGPNGEPGYFAGHLEASFEARADFYDRLIECQGYIDELGELLKRLLRRHVAATHSLPNCVIDGVTPFYDTLPQLEGREDLSFTDIDDLVPKRTWRIRHVWDCPEPLVAPTASML